MSNSETNRRRYRGENNENNGENSYENKSNTRLNKKPTKNSDTNTRRRQSSTDTPTPDLSGGFSQDLLQDIIKNMSDHVSKRNSDNHSSLSYEDVFPDDVKTEEPIPQQQEPQQIQVDNQQYNNEYTNYQNDQYTNESTDYQGDQYTNNINIDVPNNANNANNANNGADDVANKPLEPYLQEYVVPVRHEYYEDEEPVDQGYEQKPIETNFSDYYQNNYKEPENSVPVSQEYQNNQNLYQEPLNTNINQAQVNQPIKQEPVYQEPVYQEPVYQEPVYQEPVQETSKSFENNSNNNTNRRFSEPSESYNSNDNNAYTEPSESYSNNNNNAYTEPSENYSNNDNNTYTEPSQPIYEPSSTAKPEKLTRKEKKKQKKQLKDYKSNYENAFDDFDEKDYFANNNNDNVVAKKPVVNNEQNVQQNVQQNNVEEESYYSRRERHADDLLNPPDSVDYASTLSTTISSENVQENTIVPKSQKFKKVSSIKENKAKENKDKEIKNKETNVVNEKISSDSDKAPVQLFKKPKKNVVSQEEVANDFNNFDNLNNSNESNSNQTKLSDLLGENTHSPKSPPKSETSTSSKTEILQNSILFGHRNPKNIGNKIKMYFGVLLLLLLLRGLYNSYNLQNVAVDMEETFMESSSAYQSITATQNQILNLSNAMNNLLNKTELTSEEITTYTLQMEVIEGNVFANIENLENIAMSTTIASDIKSQFVQWNKYREEIINLYTSDMLDVIPPLDDLQSENLTNLVSMVSNASDKLREQSDLEIYQNYMKINRSAIYNTGLTVLILLVACLLFRQIYILLVPPLTSLRDDAKDLGVGNLNENLKLGSRDDEIGDLFRSFDTTAMYLKNCVWEISEILEDFSDDKNPSKATMKNGLEGIVISLNGMFHEVVSSMDTMLVTAYTLEENSNDLQDIIKRQSQGVEAINTSINKISYQSKENVSDAKSAFELCKQVGSSTKAGSDTIRNLVNKFGEIEEVSNKINSILTMVDEIAFQANIVALNAAIEAARAGEIGIGFREVADDIRKLASISGESAEKTRFLVDESINSIMAGTLAADKTFSHFKTVLSEMEEYSALSNNVYDATTTQEQLITEIDGFVQTVRAITGTPKTEVSFENNNTNDLEQEDGGYENITENFNNNSVEYAFNENKTAYEDLSTERNQFDTKN